MNRWRDLQLRIQDIWDPMTFAVVGSAGTVVTLLWIGPAPLTRGTGTQVDATITGISTLGSRYQGRHPGLQVGAKTRDGTWGTVLTLPRNIEGCEVGDPIEAEQVGMRLRLTPHPCD